MRYLPHTSEEIKEMLETIGGGRNVSAVSPAVSIDDLFNSIPSELQLKRPLNLPPPLSEIELRNHLRHISRDNAHGESWSVFLGAGSYSHYIPSVVSQLLLRGEFLTAYTPYQPEVSQGTLQSIFEYQTMVAEIFGMEVSNASHYDGSTATAEAALMAMALTKRNRVLVAGNLHPEYRQVLKTYLPKDAALEEIPFTKEGVCDRNFLKSLKPASGNSGESADDVACLVVSFPNFFGIVEDFSDLASWAHDRGALLVTSSPAPLALGLFKSPGEMGADIAVGEGQSFGNAMNFGGPGLGLFTAKKEFVRAMPGRLVGETVDSEGKRGFVLTLATREQHIRRERASSNICTNVALCALAATITLSLWGKKGFEELARMNFERAQDLRERLTSLPGVKAAFSGTHFNEFAVELPKKPETVVQELLSRHIIAGIPLGRWYPSLRNHLLVTLTEMNTDEQADKLVEGLKGIL